MNMYAHELRLYRRSTAGWTLALAGLVSMMMAMFPAFAADADAFKEVLKSMPEAVLQAVGLQIDGIASLLGYYSYIFLYVTLCGAIQAMHMGASMISKETREKTADFLLTKPVTRGAILLSKTLAALTLLLFTNVVYFGAASMVAVLVQRESYSYGAFALISMSLILIQLIFLALGLAAALLVPRLKTVLPLSLGTVFALFMLSAIGASTGDGKLRYLTPFQYFDRSYIVEHSAYEIRFVLVGAGIIAVCLWFSYMRYRSRDVHAG